jgi:methylamine---glutamate N-methyltransferase subunit C
MDSTKIPRTTPRTSSTFDDYSMSEIRRAAATGIYDIRGGGAKRRVPHFDDLLFLGASISRYPLEGYREACGTDVVLGNRFAKKPLHLKIPVTIAGMSFGSLSAQAKEALGRGASIAGTSTTTGDGGMTPEERGQSRHLVYQYLPSRYGMNPDDLRKADAIEVVVGQGAKPGGGGMLLGQKITDRVAEMRTLPKGIDQRSACRHPDWTGPDDLAIKIEALREITDWEKPIYVKIGATRPYYDAALCVKSGADVIVLDGMQGGTAALVALGDNDPHYEAEYNAIGSTAGAYDDWHEGKDPAGITTQDPMLSARLDPVAAGRRLANYLAVLTMETQIIARACGKSHVHNLEPEDLVALTVEAAAMARVPLAGTNWIPGNGL